MFTPDAVAAMQAHAIAAFPEESCGMVVDNAYRPLVNTHPDPTRHFHIADADYLTHADGLQAVVHSHPMGPLHPSGDDMRGQLATGVPWAIIPTDGEAAGAPIVWGAGAPVPPLIGRPFVHGVTDCYALCRDYYRDTLGIAVADQARDDEWWDHGENLYLDGFQERGFVTVDRAMMRPDDVVLMAIRSKVPNHAGIVMPNGLILHHLQKRLSRREPLGPWMRYVTHVLRHRSVAP
ncbi:Mov34/MPN/PAD-1 family protein [Azospirillum argentinense]